MLRKEREDIGIMMHHEDYLWESPDYHFLSQTELFEEIPEEGVRQILKCSGAFLKKYKKGQIVFREDEKPEYLFLLMEGKLLVTKNYAYGRRIIFFEIHEKEIFGILIQHKEGETYWYDATAVADSLVLTIPWKFLFQFCHASCEYHRQIIKNMISVQADSCVSQMKKLHILSGMTVEAKAAYLMFELADEQGELDFKMNREELADFLGVTRPSLSRSLMNLQKKGLIEIQKSRARILDYEGLEKVCHK